MLTQEQFDIFEQQITAAIDAHLAKGGKLIYGAFGIKESCCPITCLTGTYSPFTINGFHIALAKKLNFDFPQEDMWEFVHGFDNNYCREKNQLYKLGQKLRQKYLPIPIEVFYPMSSEFKQYRRKQIAQLRPYVEGEVLSDRVSISPADREAGSPKLGDMIARNPVNPQDQWLVAADYFADNFEPV